MLIRATGAVSSQVTCGGKSELVPAADTRPPSLKKVIRSTRRIDIDPSESTERSAPIRSRPTHRRVACEVQIRLLVVGAVEMAWQNAIGSRHPR
jgi:hypothetical protein